MNCRNCNRPLMPNERACASCGAPVTEFAPTQKVGTLSAIGQPGRSVGAYGTRKARSRRGVGFATGCFITLVMMALIVFGVWLFLVRPYFHQMAANQLDRALSSAVNQIPPAAVALPAGPVTIREQLINNFLVLNSSPSGAIQNATAQITPTGIRIEFQAYGLNNVISFVPVSSKNQLMASNVNLEGPIGLIMSPDELKAILDSHFADAQAKIRHPVQFVRMQDQSMEVQLGNPILP